MCRSTSSSRSSRAWASRPTATACWSTPPAGSRSVAPWVTRGSPDARSSWTPTAAWPGMARHGGGAFSGKDPSKVDRSAAYAMRWVAKHVVAAGLAARCEVQVAYAIGAAHPVGLFVETFGTGAAPDDVLEKAITSVFDLRPGAIIRDLDLLRPIYRPTAAYGHFGRTDGDFPWERLDRVEALRSAV